MHFLGIDLGSSYTKITVIDSDEKIVYQQILKTLNRNRNVLQEAMNDIHNKFEVVNICATGYGRAHFKDANITKTEISCSAIGVSKLFPVDKNIIDIGGEDIKVLKSYIDGVFYGRDEGSREWFSKYMELKQELRKFKK